MDVLTTSSRVQEKSAQWQSALHSFQLLATSQVPINEPWACDTNGWMSTWIWDPNPEEPHSESMKNPEIVRPNTHEWHEALRVIMNSHDGWVSPLLLFLSYFHIIFNASISWGVPHKTRNRLLTKDFTWNSMLLDPGVSSRRSRLLTTRTWKNTSVLLCLLLGIPLDAFSKADLQRWIGGSLGFPDRISGGQKVHQLEVKITRSLWYFEEHTTHSFFFWGGVSRVIHVCTVVYI